MVSIRGFSNIKNYNKSHFPNLLFELGGRHRYQYQICDEKWLLVVL